MACLSTARAKFIHRLTDCTAEACDADSKPRHFCSIEKSTHAKMVDKVTGCAALSCGADSAPAHVVVARTDCAIFATVSDLDAGSRSILK